eukprot:gene20966-27821_t
MRPGGSNQVAVARPWSRQVWLDDAAFCQPVGKNCVDEAAFCQPVDKYGLMMQPSASLSARIVLMRQPSASLSASIVLMMQPSASLSARIVLMMQPSASLSASIVLMMQPSASLSAECRAWGINEAVFTPGVWPVYSPLLRADFRIFDEYKFRPLGRSCSADAPADAAEHAAVTLGQAMEALWMTTITAKEVDAADQAAVTPEQATEAFRLTAITATNVDAAEQAAVTPEQATEASQVTPSTATKVAGWHSTSPTLPFPVHAFWGTRDTRATRKLVEEWGRFTCGAFSCTEIDGGHLWPLEKDAKKQWLSQIGPVAARYS